jgi:MFS family permease
MTALFLFELGSLICAVAPSSTALIVGRAIAGVGGGGVGTGSFLLIAHSVPAHQRPTLVGLLGTMYGFASIAGPLVGGAFTDNPKLTWRWCFYINLPLGGFAIAVMFVFLTLNSTKGNQISFKEQLRQMDLPGTALILPGVICLLLALQWGGTTYPWKNGRIIALLVLAGLLLIGFVIVQIYSGERATVPARVFLQRNIWSSALFGSCVTASFFVMLYYVCCINLPSDEFILTIYSYQCGSKPSKAYPQSNPASCLSPWSSASASSPSSGAASPQQQASTRNSFI